MSLWWTPSPVAVEPSRPHDALTHGTPDDVRFAWPRASGPVPGRGSPQRDPGSRKAHKHQLNEPDRQILTGRVADRVVRGSDYGPYSDALDERANSLDAVEVQVQASMSPGIHPTRC